MAGNYNTTVSASDMKLFETYLEKESHKFGNSKAFKNVIGAFTEFKNASNVLNDPKAYAKAEEALQKACKDYTDARSGAKTTSGMERLNTINRMMTYLPYWSMEHSRERLETAMDLPLNRENAGKLMQAKKTYFEKCDAAMAGDGAVRKDWTAFGRESYEHMLSGLDQLRDVSALEQYKGKTWVELDGIRTKNAVLTDTSATGAIVSERYRATCDGKDGFFTEVNYLGVDNTEYMDQLIEGEKNAGKIQISDSLKTLKDSVLNSVYEDSRWSNAALDSQDAQNSVAISNEFLKSWTEMPEGPYKEALKPMAQDYHALMGVTTLLQSNMAARPGIPTMDDYKAELKQAVNSMFRVGEGYMGDLVDKDPVLQNIFLSRNVLDSKLAKNMNTENILLAEKAKLKDAPIHLPERAAVERILNDPTAIEHLTSSAVRSDAAKTAIDVGNLMSGNAKDFEQGGNELSLRNVGMTRVANLLGMGKILAHSEKVVMNANGRKMEGCFMEFAEGLDLNSKKPELAEIVKSIDFKDNPGFNHDAANIEVLDYLCAQNDRHGKNMFYKLGEPDANGKRNIVGIQGIDNDLAFGTSERFFGRHQGGLNDLFFIDKQVADVIETLDYNTLEYTLGDLISKDQLEAMNKRLGHLQKRLKDNQMLKLKNEEWDLKPENMQNLPDAQKKIYQAGLESMDLERQSKDFSPTHKNLIVQRALQEIRKAEMQKAKEDVKTINETVEKAGEIAEDVKDTVEKTAEAVANGAEAVQQKVEEVMEEKLEENIKIQEEEITLQESEPEIEVETVALPKETKTLMNFREFEQSAKNKPKKDLGIREGIVAKRLKELGEKQAQNTSFKKNDK